MLYGVLIVILSNTTLKIFYVLLCQNNSFDCNNWRINYLICNVSSQLNDNLFVVLQKVFYAGRNCKERQIIQLLFKYH